MHRGRLGCPAHSVLEHEENVSMLSKLMEMFAPASPTRGGGARRRVNLQRRFSIVSETSRGSMSRVYRAIDNETGRTVCLKIQLREKNEAAAARASVQEPRPPEGEIAIQLMHPHVVRHVRIRRLQPGRPLPGHGIHRRREPPVRPREPLGPHRAEGGTARPGRRRPGRRPCRRIHASRHQPAEFPGRTASSMSS